MELAVYTIEGNKTEKKVVLNDAIFRVTPNDHAIYMDVRHHMAARRQGTHKTKERWEIKGSTRKLRRQKGTGAARIGNIKSPLLRGGGTAFGPQPRDYSFKLNKKVKRLARKSALSYKAKNDKLMVVEDFSMEEPRTKKFLQIVHNLGLTGQKVMFVLSGPNRNIQLSSRNLPKTYVGLAAQLNTYMIMNVDKLVFVESALPEIDQVLEKQENQD